MAITASQVKELRELTGAGMMDCKKALTATDGNMEAAVDWLREKGISKAAKKADRIAAEGLAQVVVKGNRACLVEVNTETDFVAKNEQFLQLLETTTNAICDNAPATLEEANAIVVNGKTLADLFVEAIATIGEKITLRRFEVVEKTDSQTFGTYKHNGGAIVALTVIEGDNAQVAKEMAMQVASMNPSYVNREAVPAEIVEHEQKVQKEIANNDPSFAKKPAQIQEKILEGRVSKTLQEICLVDQIFFLNQDLKCGQYLEQNHLAIVNFVKFKVGEGLAKREENFAEEVAKQMAA